MSSRQEVLEEARGKAFEQMAKQTVWHDGERNIQYNTGDALRFFEEAENAYRHGIYLAAINKLHDCIWCLRVGAEVPAYLCSRMMDYYIAYGKADGAKLWYQQMVKSEPRLADPAMEQRV